MPSTVDRAAEVIENKRRSHLWLVNNFYTQWEEVYSSYLCNRRPLGDPNTRDSAGNPQRPEPGRNNICAPFTWSSVNRNVARLTAQGPDLRFIGADKMIEDLISGTLMFQWDVGGVQRVQKKHVRQCGIFGWSVRAWHWERNIQKRRKRVDPNDPGLSPQAFAAIVDFYAKDLPEATMRVYQALVQQMGSDVLQQLPRNQQEALLNPQLRQMIMAQLVVLRGRGGMLPIEYNYVPYEGPKTDFLFIGDCYPQPNFQSIQSSEWFVTERRRNRDWLMNLAEHMPEAQAGIAELLEKHPNGTPWRPFGDGLTSPLKLRLGTATGLQLYNTWAEEKTNMWTITEEHRPGRNPRLALVGDDMKLICDIPYPYDLDGKIAFTECIVCDNLLHGVGDSAPRVMRGIQEIMSREMGYKADLYEYGGKPIIGTSDSDLYENPEKLKPGNGFRLALLPGGQNSVWVVDTSRIFGAAQALEGSEGGLARSWQMGSGDSNLSMGANVDPRQAQTATGARLMTMNMDTLTRDQVDMFTMTSIEPDAEMMFLLNRSELSDAINFDRGPYNRDYSQSEEDHIAWVKAEPAMFQRDGRIVARAGSTLADDDEMHFDRAIKAKQALGGSPNIDQRALDVDLLIALNKRREIGRYLKPEEKGPPTPPPPKTSMSVAVKLDEMPPEMQVPILSAAGVLPAPPPPPGPPSPPQQDSEQPGAPGEPAGPIPPLPPPAQPPQQQGPPPGMPPAQRGLPALPMLDGGQQ